jgi:hypothetical protein
MAIYFPLGHGGEKIGPRKKRALVPEGCSVTVIEAVGGDHIWQLTPTGEIMERQLLLADLKRMEETKSKEQIYEIFTNPKEHADTLNDYFGSVAIFGPGEKYPNLYYELEVSWKLSPDNVYDIRYSGLVPFDNFVNPAFTTGNIVKKLFSATGETADPASGVYPILSNKDSFVNNNIWLNNKLEIYKYSVFPSPEDFTTYFGTLEGREPLLPNNSLKEGLRKLVGKNVLTDEDTHIATGIDKMSKLRFEEDVIEEETEGYINVSLQTLMRKFPGHYIHLVCRDTSESTTFVNGVTIYNPNPHENYTKEEIFTRRIPYMSRLAKENAIRHIESSKNLNIIPRYNRRSMRRVSNIMLTALKRSVAQNELRSRITRKNNGIEGIGMTNNAKAVFKVKRDASAAKRAARTKAAILLARADDLKLTSIYASETAARLATAPLPENAKEQENHQRQVGKFQGWAKRTAVAAAEAEEEAAVAKALADAEEAAEKAETAEAAKATAAGGGGGALFGGRRLVKRTSRQRKTRRNRRTQYNGGLTRQ